MSEIGDVLRAIESLSSRGERMSLATIVAVRGSTYRRPGARLLVPEEGTPIGNISGGCLEGDVADVARVVMREGVPRIASWDLTTDDDEVWGLGLGCNGAIEVFIEPAERAAEVAGVLRAAMAERRPLAMIVAIDGPAAGSRILVRPDGSTEGSLGSADADRKGASIGERALAEGRSMTAEVGPGRVFVEVLEPTMRLLVCGAGHDAVPVVAAAAALGWETWIADDRPDLLSHDRFPDATGFIGIDRPDQVDVRASLDAWTHAVVMSHALHRDRDYLRALLQTPVSGISMLGPALRTTGLIDDLRAAGLMIGESELARIHSPAGLDLGAEGPEEIAASIVSEVIAVRHGRRGGFLRDRTGPIHDRSAASPSA